MAFIVKGQVQISSSLVTIVMCPYDYYVQLYSVHSVLSMEVMGVKIQKSLFRCESKANMRLQQMEFIKSN